jgi:hypothetical protein
LGTPVGTHCSPEADAKRRPSGSKRHCRFSFTSIGILILLFGGTGTAGIMGYSCLTPV